MVNRRNNGVITPGNRNRNSRPLPMTPRAGVTKTRRRYNDGGKAK